MTSTPSRPAGTRGAIDLSGALGPSRDADASSTLPAAGDSPLPAGLVTEATEANISELLNRSLKVPGVLVLWSSQHPATRDFVGALGGVAATLGGRVFVVSADLSASPVLSQAFIPLVQQAFGAPSIPATFGLVQGQPVPLFPGAASAAEIEEVLGQLLQMAVANGITGRIDLGQIPGADEDTEVPLPLLHQEAFDAIERGDLAAAAAAYEKALADDPKDADAEVGLAQVRLMERTDGTDPSAARAAAAADPADIDAALRVADLDVQGGHVEDAFTRLLDLVRSTSGSDRDRVRTHLLDLFGVVGAHDERVRKGRTALMSALF